MTLTSRSAKGAGRWAVAAALVGVAGVGAAGDSVTWEFSQTIRRTDSTSVWVASDAVADTFGAYDWTLDFTSIGATGGGSGVPTDLTQKFAAAIDLDIAGTGGALPITLLDAAWDEPDSGTLLDVLVDIDSGGVGRVRFDEIALGVLETDFGQSSVPIETLIVAGTITATGRVAGLPGDYNGDNEIDSDDYTLWQITFGSTTVLAADGNGDGVVDAADYGVWRDALAAATAAVSIPEPSVPLLIALAGVLNAARRSRKG